MDTVPAYAETRSIRDAVQHMLNSVRKESNKGPLNKSSWTAGHDAGSILTLEEVLVMLDQRLASAPDTGDKGDNHGD